mgnify:CR=1 FL=1
MPNCKYCRADCAMRGEDDEKHCLGYSPSTNADRIRSMSDEELAAFLDAQEGWAAPPDGETLAWLKKPAEEDT